MKEMSRTEKKCNYLDLMSKLKLHAIYKPLSNWRALEYIYVKYFVKYFVNKIKNAKKLKCVENCVCIICWLNQKTTRIYSLFVAFLSFRLRFFIISFLSITLS